MQKLKWDDTLLGFEIKPEGWEGGIVEYDGVWGIHRGKESSGEGAWFQHCCGNTFIGSAMFPDDVAPIYPPRGWKDKSETEIWDAIVGNDGEDPLTLQFSDIVEIGFDPLYIAYHYDIEGFVPQAHGEKIGAWLQERIQALQNALTVIERLRND